MSDVIPRVQLRIPIDSDGFAYIFTGATEREAEAKADAFMEDGEQTWDSLEELTTEDYGHINQTPAAPVDTTGAIDALDGNDLVYPSLSGVEATSEGNPTDDEDYLAVLFTQMDADSTRSGQKDLIELIGNADDVEQKVQLQSRLFSGQAVRAYRTLLLETMPPVPARGTDLYKYHYSPLSKHRERLAQWMGLGGFEAVAYGCLTPRTGEKVRELATSTASFAAEFNQDVFGQVMDNGAYVWALAPHRQRVSALDVPVLTALGVYARFDAIGVHISGDFVLAQKYGYSLKRESAHEALVMDGPDIVKTMKELKKLNRN